ncbi:unnamed protein product [Brassica napus]|uniref:(rape) hypothetical protein n=1 Tax=Brassica napus TaxID=3708 RepID=A0A816IST2_BRANA|nr:unnamed protein product [Brassica napus]
MFILFNSQREIYTGSKFDWATNWPFKTGLEKACI